MFRSELLAGTASAALDGGGCFVGTKFTLQPWLRSAPLICKMTYNHGWNGRLQHEMLFIFIRYPTTAARVVCGCADETVIQFEDED